MASRPLSKRLPWLDYSGHFAPFKAAVFAALFVPGLVTLYLYETDQAGSRPITEVIHQLGLWGIRFLAISLAMTPFRTIFAQPRLVLVRRMVGVAACVYIAIHFLFYIVDQKYDLVTVASEIIHRFYLTIGFAAFLILVALAVTSTDGMMRRLRRRWQQLHRLIYLAIIVGTIHYFIQVKLNVFEPTWFMGLIAWLLFYRLIAWRLGVQRASSIPALAILSVVTAILTGLGEYAYYATFTGVRASRVLDANFMFSTGLRPGWIVLAIGLGVTILATLWKLVDRIRPGITGGGARPAARRA